MAASGSRGAGVDATAGWGSGPAERVSLDVSGFELRARYAELAASGFRGTGVEATAGERVSLDVSGFEP